MVRKVQHSLMHRAQGGGRMYPLNPPLINSAKIDSSDLQHFLF